MVVDKTGCKAEPQGIMIDTLAAQEKMSRTINLRRSYRLSVYDAAYLELAMREGLPLATIDEQLSNGTEEGVT